MLPELDVFYPHSHQFVHPEGVALHHKDLVFVTPAGQGAELSSHPATLPQVRLSAHRGSCVLEPEGIQVCLPGFGQPFPFLPVPDDDAVRLINSHRDQTLSIRWQTIGETSKHDVEEPTCGSELHDHEDAAYGFVSGDHF